MIFSHFIGDFENEIFDRFSSMTLIFGCRVILHVLLSMADHERKTSIRDDIRKNGKSLSATSAWCFDIYNVNVGARFRMRRVNRSNRVSIN